MSKLEKIQNEILALSPEERELVGIFLKETQTPQSEDYHAAWEKELQRRLAEIQIGNATLVSSEFAVSEIRKNLHK
jgi:hypothetical protein